VSNVEGDGDFSPSQALVNGDCAVEDYQRISGAEQLDNAVGMWLVKFAAGRQCILVIDD
jgi:hypothetical protein